MNTIVLLCLAFFVCGYIFGRMVEYMVKTLLRRGSACMIWVDPDAGGLSVEWVPRKGNQVTLGKGEEGRTYILEGKARWSARVAGWVGSAWIVHARHGWNLSVPKDSKPGDVLAGPVDADTVESKEKPELRTLAIANPFSYFHAIAHNEARDALEANKEQDSMWVKLAPFAMIALVLILGGVVFIIVKIGGIAASASANAAAQAPGGP